MPKTHFSKAQALIEAALVIPILLVLFIGTVYFGLLTYNQQRGFMAARYGAWLKTKVNRGNIDNEVKSFFGDPNTVTNIAAIREPFSTGIGFLDSLFAGLSQDNFRVKVTYTQPAMPYAPPLYLDPNHDLIFSFQNPKTVQNIECAMPSRNTWKTMWQVLRGIFGL